MKKIKLILLLVLGLILAGCAKSNIEVFRFVNHEIEITVGEEAILELIYGEYDEDSVVLYEFEDKEGVISLDGNVVTGLKVGEVTIRATIDQVKYDEVIVRVVQEQISSMKINAESTISRKGLFSSLSAYCPIIFQPMSIGRETPQYRRD